jgi:hypothetical protein
VTSQLFALTALLPQKIFLLLHSQSPTGHRVLLLQLLRRKIETVRNFPAAILVLPPALLAQSPRKLNFERCCESRKKGLTFAPRFDRRPEMIEKRNERETKTFTFRLPIQNFFLPLHSQSQERDLKRRKTG